MPTFVPLADAELLLIGWLRTQFPSARVLTELPANLSGALPVIQVSRFGGSSDNYVIDTANVDVDVFAASYGAASSLAGQIRSAILLHLPGYAMAGAAVQSATDISAPRWLAYDNTTDGLRRFTAAYRITIHSIPT